MLQIMRSHKHVAKTSASLFDHIFTNSQDRISQSRKNELPSWTITLFFVREK